MDYDVLIASRYPFVREGERAVLESRGKIASSRICAVDSPANALRTLDDAINTGGTIGVVVTDLHFGNDKNAGIQLLEAIKAKYASTAVIVTSGEDLHSGMIQDPEEDPAVTAATMHNKGAFAYHHKSWPLQNLVDKVNAALAEHIG